MWDEAKAEQASCDEYSVEALAINRKQV